MLKKNKGITMVVLIITIIVLLILAAVSVNVAINGGLFRSASRLKRKTEEMMNTQQDLINEPIVVGNTVYDSSYDFAKGIASPLPKEYQEVEYIESTGTQYINTGIYPKSTTKVIFDFAFTTTGSQYNGWGSSAGKETFMWGSGGGSYASRVNSTWEGKDTGITLDTNKHRFVLESGNQQLDGIQYSTTTIGDTATSTQYMYLFAYHAEWTNIVDCPCQEKVYACQIYDGNDLVRDFVPCYRKSDLKPGLYDTVEGIFYTNQGTGEFKYPLNFEKEFQEVEYIESTGTQYINTGIYPKSTTKVIFDFAFTTTGYQNNGWGSSGGQEAFLWGTGGSSYASTVNVNWSGKDTGITLDTNKHRFVLESGNQQFDGIQYSTTTIGDTATSTQYMYLFATHAEWTNSIQYPCKEKLYSCKIFDGNDLVRDFVPCYRESDGVRVVGLYDLCGSICPLTGTPFYTNSGTGEFIYPN